MSPLEQLVTSIAIISPIRDSAWSKIIFSTIFTLILTRFICHVVLNLPGYTKALFWAITRSYEHNFSKTESVVLLSIPASMSLTILTSGSFSFAAWMITGISLYFFSTSYNFHRLRTRTDDVMRSRSQLGMMEPPTSRV